MNKSASGTIRRIGQLDLYSTIEDLISNPINVNEAGFNELERIPFMDDCRCAGDNKLPGKVRTYFFLFMNYTQSKIFQKKLSGRFLFF